MKSRTPELLASEIYCLALKAQKKILAYLNDDSLSCQVLWDASTGLPSHPSFVADVVKSVEIFKAEPELKALLNSFLGWSLFRQVKMNCLCMGRDKLEVDVDILVNTILKTNERGLAVKLLVGVRSSVNGYIEKHYHIKKKDYQSRVIDGLYIILNCENVVGLYGDRVYVEPLNFSYVDQLFGLSEFGRIVRRQMSAEQ